MENEESERLLAERTLEAMRPKLGTKFINDDVSGIGNGFIQPGTVGAMNTFGNFIVRALILPNHHPADVCRKPQGRLLLAGDKHNFTRLLVYLKTSFWTRSSTVSEDTITGP